MTPGQRALLRVAEVCAAAAFFIAGASAGYLGAFCAGLAYLWLAEAVERWADSQ